MVFFQPKVCNANSEASFIPFFRLLEDYDKHYSQKTARRLPAPTWQPKFDVCETEQTFELHGELPGANKENVKIEFADPQTLVIQGKTERCYASDAAPAAPAPSDAVDDSDKHSACSYQATVEDDFEDVAENAQPQQVEKTQPVQSQPAAPKAKYWLTERSVGEFSRTFQFPTRVEGDSTTASFKDGILTVVVPKAKKYESQRIFIN